MKSLYRKARQVIPSGVNSPVRAFRAVGGDPVFMARGKGPYIWDARGKRYVDFCCSWGPLLFGHAPSGLISAVSRALARGTSFGTATAAEIEVALGIRSFFPSMEKIRLVSSGTEAVMSAVRLARGATKRSKLLKLDGGYHGHVDSLLVRAGSGVATFGIPDSAGVPGELARLTLSVPFNDIGALEDVFRREGGELAAFILEPVPANTGVVLPAPNYLERARALTKRHGALLIFDEVITGFRVSPGGAQQYYGVRPDLTCLGKILGGGLPLAAFGGKSALMDQLAPEGPVYQAGTLSGNPLAAAAALWMLGEIKKISSSRKWRVLENRAENFYGELIKAAERRGLTVRLNRLGSMFTLFFSEAPVTDYASAKRSDTKRYAKFFHGCLKKGVYLAPSQLEANFISWAHSPAVLRRAARVFGELL
ncbi:MAG: glutamate-1-semialdehyde 2,1-aminomutase [Candidatus Omnitrophota bacterium]|jgi:glutamate-1-semialdehyde 2,1-aminomutase